MAEKVVTIPMIAASEYTNTSRVIHSGPCIVKSVHVAAVGANVNVHVYDGLNSKGKLKAVLYVLENSSYNWRPGDGTDFDYGLYAVVSTSGAQVTLTFIPESRKAFI